MTNSRGEIGEPWGTLTKTGANKQGDPWNVRGYVRSLRQEPTH